MKTILLTVTLLAAGLHGACRAADDCTAPSARTLASIDELPEAVQALLGRREPGIGGIADAGSRFNPSDAVAGMPPLPMRRFASASAGDGCYAVTLEQGGIAHWFETHIVRRERGAWRVAGTRRPAPAELPPEHTKQRQP
ncbi:hypothetical protein IP92_00228 [Pseudoduganella flava]|uniref:Lipoprotein n=1 Tax=Pseudoduganella flava TaxID=871742 RepID=A0A562Q3F9_9BURK|nr:hypothetical protein [Pseudoduganella flava]QGZ41303.1 hypothetical protein GO485_21050 [Pseudoduganella flava]TWI51244.1 hypothetical protein IP92_00228 [Pseudoduganella flava]